MVARWIQWRESVVAAEFPAAAMGRHKPPYMNWISLQSCRTGCSTAGEFGESVGEGGATM